MQTTPWGENASKCIASPRALAKFRGDISVELTGWEARGSEGHFPQPCTFKHVIGQTMRTDVTAVAAAAVMVVVTAAKTVLVA